MFELCQIRMPKERTQACQYDISYFLESSSMFSPVDTWNCRRSVDVTSTAELPRDAPVLTTYGNITGQACY